VQGGDGCRKHFGLIIDTDPQLPLTPFQCIFSPTYNDRAKVGVAVISLLMYFNPGALQLTLNDGWVGA
jgi:hypothetical protein